MKLIFNCISNLKLIILLIFFTKLISSESLHSGEFLNEIEQNQILSMDCSTFINSIEMLINDFNKLHNTSSITCQFAIKSSADKLKITIDKVLEGKLNDFTKKINGINSKLNELIEINSFDSVETCNNKLKEVKFIEKNDLTEELKKISFRIRNGKVSESDKRQLNEIGEDQLKILLKAAYNNELNNGFNVFQFINSFNENEDILLGYRLLFEEMISNQHIYSTLTTTISYKIFTEFREKYFNNPNYLHLNSKIPDSLKNFPWNKNVLIQNLQINSTIDGYRSNFFDDLRRHLFSVINTNGRNHTDYQFNFIPIANGTYFHIKSIRTNEFIYADQNSFAKDNEHRRVFGWRKKNETLEMGRWNFESIKGSSLFKIKNIYWNEYLIIDKDHIHPEYNYLYEVFTLKNNNCESDGCKWNFEQIN